ncbi:hypothetical protein Tco_1499962 [Tanacetum coccineum]
MATMVVRQKDWRICDVLQRSGTDHSIRLSISGLAEVVDLSLWDDEQIESIKEKFVVVMILQQLIDSFWLEHSQQIWVQQCQYAHSVESIELLKEELNDIIKWNEVQPLPNSVLQSGVRSEWKAVKPEIMKWFLMSNPSFNTGHIEPQTSNGFPSTGLQVSRKGQIFEIRRA